MNVACLTRRRLIAGLMVAAALTPTLAVPTERSSTPRLGVIVPSLANSPLEEGLRDGLRQAGYIEGKNIVIEWRRYAPADQDLLSLATDLAHSAVDVMVTMGSPATQAALQATTGPVVFSVVGDPVATGFAASLARPGGHATGVSTLAPELMAKRLELLHQMVPRGRRILCLTNSSNPVASRMLDALKSAARTLRVELLTLDVRNADELERALRAVPRSGAQGIIVTGERIFLADKARVAEAIRQAKLPAMVPAREYHDTGVLMSYGPNLREAMRRAAAYVDKILKGADPGDLPIEQVSTYELIIDLTAARALGLKVPQSVLLGADEVIR